MSSASSRVSLMFCSTSTIDRPSPLRRAMVRPDVGNDLRGEALRRLVHQQHARVGHQRAADRQHLLLAAGQQARQLAAALLQPRKHVEHGVEGPERLAGLGCACRHVQVLAHGEAAEHTAALRHQRQPLRGNLLGRQMRDADAEHRDAARPRRQQADGNIHAGGLAGAIAADQTEHATFAGGERHLLQHVAVAIVGVDIDETESLMCQGRPPACADRRPPRPAFPRR